MSLVYIENLNNTSDEEPLFDDSWINFWKRKKGIFSSMIRCCNKNCRSSYAYYVVGAHVKISDGDNTKKYIVPLCNTCNQSTDIMLVNDYDLVEIN